MKKYSFLAIIIIITALFVTGCAKGQNQSSNNSSTDAQQRDINRRPDFGQPEEQADYIGIVKSIIGNEVTLLKIERANRSKDNAGLKSEEDADSREKQATQAPAFGVNTGGGRMPGMGRGMRNERGEGDEDMQAQMLERMKEMSTGEVKVIIPVGIQMLMPNEEADKNKPETVEATLADVKADKMMQIWVNKDITDRQVAEFVLIMR